MPKFTRKPIEGAFALTPLCLKENQEIDYDGIQYNIEWLEKKGFHGFIQFGCMGQMNAPSEEEYNKVCNICVDTAKNKSIACVVSSTSTNTKETLRRAKFAEDAGCDGSMVALPYAFPVTKEWAVEFYQTINDELKGELAIIAYNYPPLTEINMTPALWRDHLLKIPIIKAIKESHPAISHCDEMLHTVADKINFFASSDLKFWHASMVGGKGLIGIIAWAAPKVVLKYYEECRKGNQKDPWTFEAYRNIVMAFGTMVSADMPPMASYEHGYLNALVEIGGGVAGPPRKPYGRLPQAARETLEAALQPLMKMEKALEGEKTA